jgi:D-arabinose 1-dehydrogenase-like Zn-dependent alcohol dehydrogenase
MVLGHESSGKVIKVGPNVKDLKEGNVRLIISDSF